jgi:dTDP-4-amino-4,6-dideoxygalactose transaminase
MIRRLCCPSLAELAGAALPAPVLPDNGRTSFCGYGRFALLNLFRVLGFDRGTKILLPAYICDVVELPLTELGMVPVYYGITDEFQVDWAAFPDLTGIRAMITVNYFGLSLDFQRIEEFAGRHGLIWINDNAHGFASNWNGRPLEAFGHVSITSFRKVVPTLNGALLRLNRDDLVPLKRELDRLTGEGFSESPWRYLASGILCRLRLRFRQLPDFSDIGGFRDTDCGRFRLAPGAARVYCSAGRERIRERRRAVYGALTGLCAGYDFLTVHPGLLREGNSPLVFPVTVPDPAAWSRILKQSRLRGIDIHTWPSLPEAVVAGNICGSVDRWRQLLCFPVHQDMAPDDCVEQIKKVLDAI